ncbi:MAG: ribose-5-phosphate isomerase RpiA [Planctomycetota bacterium]
MSDVDQLAQAAVLPVTDGMLVGLGTGRAATRAIHALAERVREQALKITCVSTSSRTEALAAELGLRPVDMGSVERVDYLFDGADEVDRHLRMIKGGGGAMTREKVVAQASDRCVYLVQRGKIVEHLGHRHPLPIEVLPFGLAFAMRVLHEELPLEPVLRVDESGAAVVTDNGHVIIDTTLRQADADELDALATWLDETPGVVGHGLFLEEADELIVEEASGELERIVRAG